MVLRITIILTFIIPEVASGQIIPDLLKYDNYRPYKSEAQLQEEIKANTKMGFPRTSEELYPNNYKYVDKNPLGSLKGTSADPANAFTDYTEQTQHNLPSTSPVPASIYSPHLTTHQKNIAIYEADLAAYNAKKTMQAQKIGEAMQAYNSIPRIEYSLGVHNGKSVEGFNEAYAYLQAMLLDKEEIDFVKAIFMVERAYDQSLTWEEFSNMFKSSKEVIERLMIQDQLDPTDDMAKIMSIFKYMADTTEVYFEERERPVITHPMLYDYEDYGGKKDATKIFVSKLLRTGTGQCMSLPMLYFLYAKSLNTKDVYMALAPQHSFVQFKDRLGNWNNIELTGRMFTSDDFQWQGGFVKAPQVKSGIYLKPLTDKETIAYMLTTLTLTYIKSFGNDDRSFDMALTAKDHFQNSLTANSIIASYYKDLFNNVLRQYRVHGLTQKDLDNDKNAQTILSLRNNAIDYLYEDLGYEKIPDWHYEGWLKSVNDLARRNQHIVKRRQLEQQLK